MLRRHPQAEIDLAGIRSFIAANDEDAATRIVSAIDRKCRLIEPHPTLGRPRPEIAAMPLDGCRRLPDPNRPLPTVSRSFASCTCAGRRNGTDDRR